MKKPNRAAAAYIVFAGLTLLLGVGVYRKPQNSLSQHPLPTPEAELPRTLSAQLRHHPFAGQLNADLRAAVEKNRDAESQLEWIRSGFTPEDIFANVSDLDDAQGWGIVCGVLKSFKDEDLSLFKHALSEPRFAAHLSCSSELLGRIRNYWSAASVSLEEMVPEVPEEEQKLPTETRSLKPGAFIEEGFLKRGQITLTFDDGPSSKGEGITEKILETLAKWGVRANFFSVGQMARDNPELVTELMKRGHTVGSHTMSHPDLVTLPSKDAEASIMDGANTLSTILDRPVTFFRFPYGSFNDNLKSFVIGKGFRTFYWDMDSLDWKTRDPKKLLSHIRSELDRARGGILLMHDIHEQTALVLPKVMQELKARRFNTVVFVP